MAITVASLEAILSLSKDKFDQGLKGAKGALGELGGKAAKAAGAGIATGAAVGAAAIAGISVAAFNVANDLDTATAGMAASLGISKEAAGEFRDEMKDIFAAGFGENFDEIGQSLALVKKSIDGIDDKSLKDVAQGALALQDNFDKDVNETVDAAAVLMDEFGLSGQQALDFITRGLQTGLDRNGDFLDSIREYGNLFGNAEATAGEFFSLLESGAQGGVLGTDKAADAFKEFQIRFLEGGSAVEDAFASMGENWQEWVDDVATGDFRTADAFTDIINMLGQIEDPIERNRIGVALLGTQFEDLGANAALALNTGTTSLEDMAGATDGLNQKYDTLGAALEGIKRKGLVALEPLGKGMLDALNEVMPQIVAFFDDVIGPAIERFATGAVPIITEFADKLSATWGPAMDVIGDATARINKAFGGTGEELDIINVALGVLDGILDAVVFGIQATAIAFSLTADAIELVSSGVKTVVTWFDTLGEKLDGLDIPDWLKPGSPPPLALGLADISNQLKAMPDMSAAFNAGAMGAAAGGGGGGGNTYHINIGDVRATTVTGGADEAINETLRLLTEALQAG